MCPSRSSPCLHACRAKVMLQVLAALPALTSFNISHTILEPSSSGTDNVLKAALSARGTGQACGLRVLRAAGCPRLSNGTVCFACVMYMWLHAVRLHWP